jgi:hypothetical protein
MTLRDTRVRRQKEHRLRGPAGYQLQTIPVIQQEKGANMGAS